MHYVTEDRVTLQTGNRAYDYYSREPGTIGRDNGNGWFEFKHDNGKVLTLNGQRICSEAYARSRGWIST